MKENDMYWNENKQRATFLNKLEECNLFANAGNSIQCFIFIHLQCKNVNLGCLTRIGQLKIGNGFYFGPFKDK